MKWNIVADSSCDMFDFDRLHANIDFYSVPFSIQIEGQEFVDDENLNVDQLIDSMEKSKLPARTACASPEGWYKYFQKSGNVIAFTISSNISGSYSSACIAREMILEKMPDKKIAIIDTLSCGPEIILLMKYVCGLIEANVEFDSIINLIEEYKKKTHLIFTLSSFDNLVRNGRMNRLKGAVAGTLNIIGIGVASDGGIIEMKVIARGRKRAIRVILDDMRQRGIEKGTVIITHCQNAAFAEQVKEEIEKVWGQVKVTVMPTRGLCSIYAEKNGLLIGY